MMVGGLDLLRTIEKQNTGIYTLDSMLYQTIWVGGNELI